MSLVALGAMVVLLLLNGYFVAAEFAFTAASRHDLEMRSGRAARAAVRSIDELSFTLAGAQLGITIASLLLGAVAEPAVASIIELVIGGVVDIPDDVLHSIALVISLAIVVFLHMVIGEMGPKNIAIADPERSSLIMALPFRAYSRALRPVIWALNEVANLMLRAVGIDPTDTREVHTTDDLASLITAGRREGVVEAFTHRLLTGAIHLWDLHADDIMVPRTSVVALPTTATPRDVERTVVEHGFTRIPVYEGTIDQVRGFVHAKDLLSVPAGEFDDPLPARLVRELVIVPESAAVGDVLETMRRTRNHLAFVIDEHGGMAGIVTMEDVVEEVVGEIRDEYDRDLGGIRQVSANRYIVDASLRPAEVRRSVGVELPEGEYETLGGLIMERLGRIPAVGDRVAEDDWTIRVRSMDGRRVGEADLIVARSAP